MHGTTFQPSRREILRPDAHHFLRRPSDREPLYLVKIHRSNRVVPATLAQFVQIDRLGYAFDAVIGKVFAEANNAPHDYPTRQAARNRPLRLGAPDKPLAGFWILDFDRQGSSLRLGKGPELSFGTDKSPQSCNL